LYQYEIKLIKLSLLLHIIRNCFHEDYSKKRILRYERNLQTMNNFSGTRDGRNPTRSSLHRGK